MRAHREMRGSRYLIFSMLSFVLLSVLIFLPIAPAFADESVPESVDSTSVSTSEEFFDSTVHESQVMLDEVDVSTQNTEIAESDVSNIESEPSLTDVVDDTVSFVSLEQTKEENSIHTESTEVVSTSDNILETELNATSSVTEIDALGSSTEMIPEELGVTFATTTGDTLVSEVVEYATTTKMLPITTLPETIVPIDEIEIIDQTPATTTSIVGNVVTVVNNNENKFSFSKDECTTVGDGTFYCAIAKTEPEILHVDRIFSAPDADGDKEIYMEKEGVLTALTDNQSDDDAPYFDEVADTIVWHRLVEGRYQIMQYNVDDNEEIQLTHDSFNNMQPRISGDIVVWQGWVGDDWEIFLSEEGSVRMLTDNTEHDIAPSINGNHLVWQSFEGEAWRMKVYDMRTGVIDTIENAEGGSILNPRFVLVYDTKLQSGDTETRGYDLESGEVIALSAKPIEVPEEIPDPDQTGEERALVSPSVQPKSKTETTDDDDFHNTPDFESDIESGDIVIPPFTASSTGEQSELTAVATTTTDLVIPTYEQVHESTEKSVELQSIEDVVVEPYAE